MSFADYRKTIERGEDLCNESFVEKIVELETEVARLKALLDRDQTGLAQALCKVKDAVQSRSWVLESRGPYEWDDDRYKDETGRAMREVVEIATKALAESGRRADEAFHPKRQQS